nr:ribonuclease H-like domain-containing protein [Tanacetum cinerariifolium]
MSVHSSEHNTPINSDHDDDINDSVTIISKLDISDPLHLHPNDTTALTMKQFDAMVELPKCVCNVSESFKKHFRLMKLMQFLMGLDDSYMQIRSSILSREVLPDVRSAYATISSEESHRVVVGSIVGSSQRNQASAFVSNVPNSQNYQRSNQSFNAGPSRPYNVNNNRQGEGSGLNNNRLSGGSGANQHMTYTNKGLDNVVDISHLKIKVGHPNGTEAFISKIENLKLSNGLTLYDVMVILEYCVTLISVHKMAKENKIFVVFVESICYFLNQDLNLKNVLGTSEQCEGLYYYNEQGTMVNKSNQSFQCLLSQYDWHYRLGHPAEPVMNVLKKSLKFDKSNKDLCCEVCQRAKQTKEPFLLSDHVSSSLGELVHLDLWGPYRVTSSEGLPSSVLSEKSSYEMIYKECHSLSHLRVFGCLCFATLVNSSDKFSSRSEKCVLFGYSSVKKGYRLYSFDKHQFIFSRDVKFFENIFPFKDYDKVKDVTENVFQDVNHINFFNLEYPETPNDDERVDLNLNCGNKKSQSASSSSFMSGRISVTVDFSDNSENDANSSDNNFATQDEGVTTLEENVKYGIEKYVGYSKLNSDNYCFITQLNKNFKPKSFFEASKFPYWIDAMNQEMNALLRNGAWDIVDLPKDLKLDLWLRVLAKKKSCPIFQLDVNNAFLYCDLDEVVYIRPPEGFFSLQFIINPEEDDVEPGVVLGRSFRRLTKGIADFGNGTVTIYPKLDQFLDNSEEEEKIGDDRDLLLDDLDFGDILNIEGVEVSLMCDRRRNST